MAETCWRRLGNVTALGLAAVHTTGHGAGADFKKGDTSVHSDRYPICDHHRLSVREEPALPILRLHCLVDPVTAVAERAAPGAGMSCMGCAGMGVERLSQHKCQLRCSGGLPGANHCSKLGCSG